MKREDLQTFAEILREIPKGKPILSVTNLPYGGSITMVENEDGAWEVTSENPKEIALHVSPPDAFQVLYPLFARIHTKDL